MRSSILCCVLLVGWIASCRSGSREDSFTNEELAATEAALAAAGEALALIPEYEPILTAARSDREGIAWLQAALKAVAASARSETSGTASSTGALEARAPAQIPGLGDEEFGRPLVVIVDEAALAGDVFGSLLAEGGREIERREPLDSGLQVIVLRSITGGPLPWTARVSVFADMRAARGHAYSPSDGGGRAWLEEPAGTAAGTPSVAAGGSRAWHIVYEAGSGGVAVGGGIYLQSSPFWKWSTPQTEQPGYPGYTTVETQAAGVELLARTLGQQLLLIEVAGRALRPGERVRIVYGAGPAGARGDDYAERSEHLWVAVDGDGDGFRKVLKDSPRVDVLPREAARLLVRWPSVARPGAQVRLTVCVLDAGLNTGLRVEGQIHFDDWPEGRGPAPRLSLEPDQEGRAALLLTVPEAGVQHITARFTPSDSGAELTATSNPLLVDDRGPLVHWGDLHGHTNLSDGTGLPEDYFVYARDVAALDVAALTDHDDWGLLPLTRAPEAWDRIQDAVRAAHAPGEFVALLGYEWTSWIFGHRHVLYFGDTGQLYSSLDRRYDTPQELWEVLRPTRALSIPHHSAGGPIATDWSMAPDPELEPVVEVSSSHGTSEAADAPRTIYASVRGNFVRDALQRGYRFGLIGSGDSHDGHPGLSWEARHYPNGGLVALLTDDLTREGVRRALVERRVYATNGPRMVLRCSLAGRPMGSTLALRELPEGRAELFVWVLGTAPIERIDVVRSGQIVSSLTADQSELVSGTLSLEQLGAGEFVYVRVVQVDDGVAWSTPFYVTEQ